MAIAGYIGSCQEKSEAKSHQLEFMMFMNCSVEATDGKICARSMPHTRSVGKDNLRPLIAILIFRICKIKFRCQAWGITLKQSIRH